MIHFMEENIKSKLQLKYIFNIIRFKFYSGGCMKGFYSKKKKKKTTTTTMTTTTTKNKAMNAFCERTNCLR